MRTPSSFDHPLTVAQLPIGDAAAMQGWIDAFGPVVDGFDVTDYPTSDPRVLTADGAMEPGVLRRSPDNVQFAHLRTSSHTAEANVARIRRAHAAGLHGVAIVSGEKRGDAPSLSRAEDVLEYLRGSGERPALPLGVAADIYKDGWNRWDAKAPYIEAGIVNTAFTHPIFRPDIVDAVRGKVEGLLAPANVFVGVTAVESVAQRDAWAKFIPADALPAGADDAGVYRDSLARARDTIAAAEANGYSVFIGGRSGIARSSLRDILASRQITVVRPRRTERLTEAVPGTIA